MEDFLGRPLAVGDDVVAIQLRYRNLIRGTITKMTEKTIWIQFTYQGRVDEFKQTPDQVVKLNP